MDILENYPDGKELYWCHWSKELPSLRALEMLQAKDGNLVAIEGFDDAMYDIYKVVDFELDEVLASYEERRNEIRRFIDVFREKYPNTIIEESIQEIEQPKHKPKGEPSTWFEYYEAAYQAKENKDLAIAEKYYRKAIELNPTFEDTFISFGNMLVMIENRRAEAEENYLKAIELNPNKGSAYINLAYLYLLRESRDEALRYLKQGINIDSKLKSVAKNYSGFNSLHNDERFWEIVGRNDE